MTDKYYECIYEVYMEGFKGLRLGLRDWLNLTAGYKKTYDKIDDDAIVQFLKEEYGKVLVEVENE